MKVVKFFNEAALYILLVAIGVAFTLPLLWMMVTSVKVDREFMDASRVLPEVPRPAESSPYLTGGETNEIHSDAHARWLAEVRSFYGERAPESITAAIASEAARLAGEETELTSDQIEFLLDRAWRQNVRELLVRKPVLRSRIRRTFEYAGSGWNTVGERVRVKEPYRHDEEGTRLVAYDFRGANNGFMLRFPLEMDPGAIGEIDEIVMPVHTDDSWHRVFLTLETPDGVWRSRSPFYLLLGSGGWTELSWRKPDFPRSRLAHEFFQPLRALDGGGNGSLREGEVLLTLHVERSHWLQAIWGKIGRNYEMVFAAMPFARYLLNSLILVALNVIAAIFSCSLAGYAFARLRWRGRQVYFIIMLATMTIPPQVTMVPTFMIMRHLGLYNTYLPLVLPSMIAVPFFVFLLRQFLKNIPRDLEDAALIDGCSHLRIYWHIMLPLIKPTLVIVAIFTFIATWNDFLGPLIYLSDQNLYPVSLGIFAFQSHAGGVGLTNPALMMAASTLMILPVIAVFFFAQRYFTQGIKMTGIK